MADYIEYIQLGAGSEALPIRDPNARDRAFTTAGTYNGDYNNAPLGTWWTQPGQAASNGCSNYPEDATFGFLTTSKSNNQISQTYTQYSSGITWFRSNIPSNNAWYGWFRIDGLNCAEKDHTHTAAAVGAAPAGLVYKTFSSVSTNDAIAEALNTTLAEMGNGTLRYIRIGIGASGLDLSQNTWVVRIYKNSDNYGFAEGTAYGSNTPTVLYNTLYNGQWVGWSYVNPTGTAGTPYRTTERYRGKPVYTKIISFGTAADQKAIDTGLAVDTYLIIRYAGTLNGTPLPYHYTTTSDNAWFRVYAGATYYSAMLHIPAADAGLGNTYLQIWYCEK